MNTLKDKIFDEIRGCCISDESAKCAAEKVVEIVQKKLEEKNIKIASICDEHNEAILQGLIGNECSFLFEQLRQLSHESGN